MVTKPAIANRGPITVSVSGVAISSPAELIAVHYLNLTGGVGRVDIYDGPAIPANLRITLGAGITSGTDDFCPNQPGAFKANVNVQFTTGSGVVTLLAN